MARKGSFDGALLPPGWFDETATAGGWFDEEAGAAKVSVKVTWAEFEVPAAAAGTSLKYWTGAAWLLKPLKRWNGAAWVPATLKRWNGSAWV